MAAEVMAEWVKDGRHAVVNQRRIKPVEHDRLKGKPLSSQKGQAEAFFVTDDKGNWLVLKKFHNGRAPDRAYLLKVGSLLPRDPGFACGTDRHILSKGDLVKARGCHYNAELGRWLDGTVIMPKVGGLDWSSVADEIREGARDLDITQRFTLCRDLTRLVELLEADHCCHRDLSCGNVFIETATWTVSLIDFGSFYHPSLRMPKVTTCGTEGYTAPYAWDNGTLNARRTWCEGADRYALGLLIAEFLLVKRGTEATFEGGIFEQTELRNRFGRGMTSILSELAGQYPPAAQLLQRAIHSRTPKDCPSPQEWNQFFDGAGAVSTPMTLADMPEPSTAKISDILSRCRPAAPLWPAPSLSEMPLKIPQIPKGLNIPPKVVSLPPDPWEKKPLGRKTLFGRPKS
jgi:serine/threonine protein kinase